MFAFFFLLLFNVSMPAWSLVIVKFLSFMFIVCFMILNVTVFENSLLQFYPTIMKMIIFNMFRKYCSMVIWISCRCEYP